MRRRILAFLLIFSLVSGLGLTVFPREKAEAAIAFLYDKKKANVILNIKKAKEIFVGGKSLDLGYNIGGIKKGVKGKWVSSKPSVVKVSSKGKVTAVGNGTAIVSFKYQGRKKEVSIRCKIEAKTRASSIAIVAPSDFTGAVVFGSVNAFQAKMTTNPKALKLNSKVTHSYKTFFELFMDAELKNPAPSSLATVNDDGILIAKEEVGTVYLRAVGKLSKNSKTGVIYSAPLAISIEPKFNLHEAVIRQTALNQFEISFDKAEKLTGVEIWENDTNLEIGNTISLSEDRKVVTVNAVRNLTKTARVILKAGDKKEEKIAAFSDQKVSRIELVGTEAALVKFENNKGRAEIAFRLLDQFGSDVTFDERFANKSYAVWMNKKAKISKDGRIGFDLTPEQSVVGFTGNLMVTYAGKELGTEPVVANFGLKIGNFRVAKDIKIDGIYKKLTTGYVKVMGGDGNLAVGSILGNHSLPTHTDVYAPHYLLIKVTDSTGVSMAETGADSQKYQVKIISSTGLELDKLTNSEVKSIDPVIIDGIRYLTYPLKPGVLREGDIVIKVEIPGTKMKDIITGKVSTTTASSGNLEIYGEGYVDEDNLVQFILKNANNERVKKYEEVLSTLGLADIGVGQVFMPADSNIIRSANGSTFFFRKNSATGEAELYYRPFSISLGTGMKENIEEITVFKGSANEDTGILTVKSR